MKILLLKASDDYWYKILTIHNIEDLFSLIKRYKNDIILSTNTYKGDVESYLKYWDGLTIEDAKQISKIDYQITIYNDYIE